MPKITVSNLPVTTFVNATVDVEDGPEHTLHRRIADAARAGRWERAHGALAEDYEDLTLELNEKVLDYPLWSFDILAGDPPTPARITGELVVLDARPAAPLKLVLTHGTLPTREQFDAAWERENKSPTFSFENDPRVGTRDMTRDQLWDELQTAAHVHDHGSDRAGKWCSDVLGILGIEWV